jgi:hypothetical protein
MEKKFEYRGDLAVTPLPEILATIERYRVPGALTVTRGDAHRRIYLDNGLVVFATSDEPEVRLGNYLIRHGTLPADAVESAEARLAGDGIRLGHILVTLELLDQATLDAAVAEQVREILWSAFDWDTGEVVFEVGGRRSDEAVRIDLPIPEVIVEGVRCAGAVRRFIDRMGSGHAVLEQSAGVFPAGVFKPDEVAFRGLVDGRTSVQLLCENGPGSVAENARLLYAFFCLDLVRVRESSGVKRFQWKTEGGGMSGAES